MKIAIVQLSDIHITSDTDPVLQRAELIASSLYQYAERVEQIFLVLSGDIAYSGKEEQYDCASTFIDQILDSLKNEYRTPVSIVMVPGNHDCDFKKNTSVRKAVIAGLNNAPLESIDEDQIDQCVSVQEAYFLFQKRIAAHGLIHDDHLWTQYRFEMQGKTILFDCLNVAWVSNINEQQGGLYFPYQRYSGRIEESADIRFVVLHHPMHWLSQEQYRDARARVRSFGDIILTGHEHVEGAELVDDAVSGESMLIEAGALQVTGDENISTFNVIEIDVDENQYKRDVFSFENGEYCSDSTFGSWASFKALPKRKSNIFELSDQFCTWLDDAGASYSHPSKTNLSLGDIYIFPDLEDLSNDEEDRRIVNSNLLREVSNIGKGAIITGEEKAGKTALLKTLFLEYYGQGLIPIYIDLKDVTKATDAGLSDATLTAVKQQYSEEDVEKWLRVPKSQKILLLDDLGRARIADKYRWKILEYAHKHFHRIIITAGEAFELSEATSYELVAQTGGFSRFHIQSFGHKLRYKLIRKWRCIGNDYTISSAGLLNRIDSAEKILDTVVGKNLVPRVPLYLLTLLQSLESSNTTDLKNSGFGHYYEYLITDALAKVRVNPGELDEFYNYLSQLAWLFYSQGRKELEYSEIEQFTRIYSEEYSRVECGKRLDRLFKARLVDKRGNYYSFNYPYVYYFFLGKYISENLQYSSELRNTVEKCAEHAYTRDNANILLFTIHHQKNEYVIDCLLSNLQNLFSEYAPVTFDGDTGAFNELAEDTARLIYQEKDPEQYRIDIRGQQDEAEIDLAEDSGEEEQDSKLLDLPSTLNKLFKTIEILGQLLKSYYGSIKNERKREIISDVYSGPLRALRQFLTVLEQHREPLIKVIEEYISAKESNFDKIQRKKQARIYVFNLVGFVALGCISKSASATSSRYLRDVSRSVLNEHDDIAYRLTNLASQLDMPGDLPFEDIESLSNDTEKNIFSHRLLESIVLRHLYFFHVSEKDKQRICGTLGISMQYQRSLDIRSKAAKIQ
ncbi:metallophosphoesterase [Thiolapillus sp.]|uniref:STAND family AAA ATPase n=2 Tax=Thiolapillus sp. TaxID=2017437 RepID=UPI003AF843F9